MTEPATEPFAIELRGISKAFGPVQANQDINLEIRAGEVLGLLGENGAGKSTLMKLIYGVETPDEGTIEWRGEPTQIGSPAIARRASSMVLPASRALR